MTCKQMIMASTEKVSWKTAMNDKGEYVRKQSKFRNFITGKFIRVSKLMHIIICQYTRFPLMARYILYTL